MLPCGGNMKKDEDMARPGMRHTMMMRFRKVLHSDYSDTKKVRITRHSFWKV